jgi:hypothetical protein
VPVVRRARWGRPVRAGPIIIVGQLADAPALNLQCAFYYLGVQPDILALGAKLAEPGIYLWLIISYDTAK